MTIYHCTLQSIHRRKCWKLIKKKYLLQKKTREQLMHKDLCPKIWQADWSGNYGPKIWSVSCPHSKARSQKHSSSLAISQVSMTLESQLCFVEYPSEEQSELLSSYISRLAPDTEQTKMESFINIIYSTT